MTTVSTLSNADIAELLALEAENAEGHLVRAYKRASRAAFRWPLECADLVTQGRSLTELPGIGPYLSHRILDWLRHPPLKPAPIALREDFLTATEVRSLLDSDPAWQAACQGDLQMHSTWSDGSSTLEELAQAGVERGYHYIAVTDHSKGLKIAGGIDENALLKQRQEILAVNRSLEENGESLQVLQAMEMNIDPEGHGDMDSEALGQLDIVLGSFHSKLRREEDQTERYLKALMNPDIQVLGHPRGRIYNFRLGLKADWEVVFRAAKGLDKAVEIDGYPDRQDLNSDLLRLAQKIGVRISMGSDAHNASQLRFLDYSLAAALKAGIPASRIVNFMGVDQLRSWVAGCRGASKYSI